MPKSFVNLPGFVLACFSLVLILASCNYRPLQEPGPALETAVSTLPVDVTPEIPTPSTPRLLTICMGQEPASLFLYGDASQPARTIRQAIFDGPLDLLNTEPVPVILERIPTLANGDVWFEPLTIQPGASIVDSTGMQIALSEGVSYLPAGCADFSCAAIYSGQDSVQIDQQVVRFQLLPDLVWSDGASLTADDSVFSFEIAKSLYPQARPDLVARTYSYQTVDERTVEWRGVPGYRFGGYIASFFTPLPRHAWGAIAPKDLLANELSTRKPLGWGAYQIDEWTVGDHITLSRNPNYHRKNEGLPFFEKLVVRFIADADEALRALQAGECDYLDESINLASSLAAFQSAQADGKLEIIEQVSGAWEHLDFGIAPLNPSILPLFQARETRQAVALCLDRQKIVDEIMGGASSVMDSYLSRDHPLFNPDIKRYPFDPGAAAAALDSIGWRDDDGNPATPRRAQAVSGVPDGTLFEFTFSTVDEPQQQQIAEIVRDSLAQCGMNVRIQPLPADQLFGAGPEAVIFGRNFSLTQFGWMGAWQPPCFLYTTQEIPGPYPQYPKGWGGANASGFSNPDFDRTCQRAMSTLPEQPEYQAAHFLAQSIFADFLPALPLYSHVRRVAARPGLCGINLDPSADSALWNLEGIRDGESCP